MIAAFSISPGGVGDSVSDVIADCLRIVRDSGLPYELNAMFTLVEGDWGEVIEVIHRCVERTAEVAPRVGVVIKIDHRPGVEDGLTSKVRSVEEKLS